MPGDKTRRAVDVLVVDDDEAVRASLADILRTSGFTVEVAEDGDVALTLLDQLVVKMIVLDLRMPHRDGFSVLDELDDPPPIVLTSAFSVDNEMRKRVGAKVTAYMQKPVSPHRLLPIVAGIVWAS